MDDKPIESLSTQASGADGTDRCIPSEIWSTSQLPLARHELVVKNGLAGSGSGAGTLELNSIKFVNLHKDVQSILKHYRYIGKAAESVASSAFRFGIGSVGVFLILGAIMEGLAWTH